MYIYIYIKLMDALNGKISHGDTCYNILRSACMHPAVICRKGWREVRTGEAKEAHSQDRLQETGTSFANSGEL